MISVILADMDRAPAAVKAEVLIQRLNIMIEQGWCEVFLTHLEWRALRLHLMFHMGLTSLPADPGPGAVVTWRGRIEINVKPQNTRSHHG